MTQSIQAYSWHLYLERLIGDWHIAVTMEDWDKAYELADELASSGIKMVEEAKSHLEVEDDNGR